jgi:hypothetical protein
MGFMATRSVSARICKCGAQMGVVNVAVLPATYDYRWRCYFRRWFNFWKHTPPQRITEN